MGLEMKAAMSDEHGSKLLQTVAPSVMQSVQHC